MRLFVTTMSPCGMISSPFIVTIRAPDSTTLPTGRSLGTIMVTSNRFAVYAYRGIDTVSALLESGLAPAFSRLSARWVESRTAVADAARS